MLPWTSTTRPELDHHVPRLERPMLVDVMDSRENRIKNRGARSNDGHCRVACETGVADRIAVGVARPTKSARCKLVQKGTAARELDQFYTLNKIAARCIRCLARRYDLVSSLLVEPSAGDGAFSGQLPVNTIAFDIEPKFRGILKANFLSFELRSEFRTITVGNPPFGRNACLAVDFFNHAARQSDVIAMIFPRSFLKASIENRLDHTFHLVYSKEVPPNAFKLDGECRDVAAVFQIWERRATPRAMRLEESSHRDFEFTGPAGADFLIRRVGAKAGEISHVRKVHEDSYYFIKGDVEHIMRQLDLKGAAGLATSTPSLARSEIVALYRQHVEVSAKRGRLRPTLPPSLRRRRR